MNTIASLDYAAFKQTLEAGGWDRHDLLAMRSEINTTIGNIALQVDARDLEGTSNPEWKASALKAKNFEKQKLALVELALSKQGKVQDGGWLYWTKGRWVATRRNPLWKLIEEIETDPEASLGEYHRITSAMWDNLPSTVEIEIINE